MTAADPHREECTMKHTKKITILHSNDLHGDFLAEQVDEKLVGGVSMLSGYIEKVRAEEPNTLYAIAGDMFRGSVIDSSTSVSHHRDHERPTLGHRHHRQPRGGLRHRPPAVHRKMRPVPHHQR
ncbi:MAG: hypothetical protein ACLVJH_07065 [Faecalibacterium prausnitzii]